MRRSVKCGPQTVAQLWTWSRTISAVHQEGREEGNGNGMNCARGPCGVKKSVVGCFGRRYLGGFSCGRILGGGEVGGGADW